VVDSESLDSAIQRRLPWEAPWFRESTPLREGYVSRTHRSSSAIRLLSICHFQSSMGSWAHLLMTPSAVGRVGRSKSASYGAAFRGCYLARGSRFGCPVPRRPKAARRRSSKVPMIRDLHESCSALLHPVSQPSFALAAEMLAPSGGDQCLALQGNRTAAMQIVDPTGQ
jgi:hypothetical protein